MPAKNLCRRNCWGLASKANNLTTELQPFPQEKGSGIQRFPWVYRSTKRKDASSGGVSSLVAVPTSSHRPYSSGALTQRHSLPVVVDALPGALGLERHFWQATKAAFCFHPIAILMPAYLLFQIFTYCPFIFKSSQGFPRQREIHLGKEFDLLFVGGFFHPSAAHHRLCGKKEPSVRSAKNLGGKSGGGGGAVGKQQNMLISLGEWRQDRMQQLFDLCEEDKHSHPQTEPTMNPLDSRTNWHGRCVIGSHRIFSSP